MKSPYKFIRIMVESECFGRLKARSDLGFKAGKMQRKKMLKVFSECFSRRK
jgi:hypothetical protein